jgi:hypothetical protein
MTTAPAETPPPVSRYRLSWPKICLFLCTVFTTTRNNVAGCSSSSSSESSTTASSRSPAKKVKVYILAGQSNMEGHGEVATTENDTGMLLNGTLLYQVYDVRTRDEFRKLWNFDTKTWIVRPDIKVWFNEADGGNTDGVNGSTIPGINGLDYSAGDLTVGFGTGGPSFSYGPFFGPELGFGWGLDLLCNDKVLIIKTAWGGKTLAHDFRPPSSTLGSNDPYCQPPDCDPTTIGHYYQVMIDDVRKLLAPGVIGTIYPDLTDRIPIVSGFGWFQGWNDGCNVNDTAGTYNTSKWNDRKSCVAKANNLGSHHVKLFHFFWVPLSVAYETNMVNLIKDLRTEFKEPYLPVSIAVSGFGGRQTTEENRTPSDCWDGPNATKVDCQSCGQGDRECRRIDVILSQFAAADIKKHPELRCCVEAVETRDFWRPAEFSPNHRQDYHFYHNAETHYLVGNAMAEGMNKATRERNMVTKMAPNTQLVLDE